MNRQILRVTSLPAAKYILRIDGEAIGSFTKEQLAEGINLARAATPMRKQAAEVHALTLKHNKIDNARWRSVQMALADDAPPSMPAALEALDKLEADLMSKQREAAQPKSRRYELTAE